MKALLRLLALLVIVGTYWTIEVFYAWFKAWGDPHLDDWYTVIAWLGIGAGVFLYLSRGGPPSTTAGAGEAYSSVGSGPGGW